MTQCSITTFSSEKSQAEQESRVFREALGSWRIWMSTIVLLGALCCSFASFGQTARELARERFEAKDRREYPLAIRLFSEALKQGEITQEQRGFILYGRGVAYEALGVRDLALEDLDAAIALLPDFSNAYVYRALVWSDARQFRNARDDLLQALRLNPGSALIHNNLGSVHERMGDLDLAVENYGAAIRLDPGYFQAFYNRAHAHMAKQDYLAAIADYDRAIGLRSDFADAYSNRGGMYLLLGEVDKAIKDFDEAIRLKGDDPIYWSNRANAYLTSGRFEQALADFDRAQSIDPGNAAIYIGRGRARLYSGKVPGAIEDLQVAARLRPTNAHPAIWLHIARSHQGSPDRQELEHNASRVDRARWPASILDFYLGKVDAESTRKEAERGPTAYLTSRLCEADFYVGESLLHGKDEAKGRKLLEAVIDRCRPANLISAAATAELSGKIDLK